MSNSIIHCDHIDLVYTYSEHGSHTLKEFLVQFFHGHYKTHSIHALKDLCLDIKKGESVALMGHNGSGKSTLLKVLAGIIIPQKGALETNGRVAPMIELGIGFDGELSGYENIMLSCTLMGLRPREIKARIQDIIEFSELRAFIDMPLKNYSSGMHARLGFACATSVDPDILLVDEVLSVGDQNFSVKCLKRIDQLREKGCTVVLVSHSMQTVRTFCTRGVVLENGESRFDGPIEDAVKAHEALMEKRLLASQHQV